MMLVLTEPAVSETSAKNSRFLTEATFADSAEMARSIWRQKKTQYDNGGHIQYAFIVGPQGNIMGCSDDGEPSGTAGRPMLEVLKGSGITNIIVTAARWFGGTRLGTGGLVRAFTTCAQTVLQNAKTAELVPVTELMLTLPYPFYRQAKRILGSVSFSVLKEDFSGKIRIQGKLNESDFPVLKQQLTDLLNGEPQLEILNPPENLDTL